MAVALDVACVAPSGPLRHERVDHGVADDHRRRRGAIPLEARVRGLLQSAGVDLAAVDFLRRRTDDCWVRDNGPIFVHGPGGEVVLTDWGFDGWGGAWGPSSLYRNDDVVPGAVAELLVKHGLVLPLDSNPTRSVASNILHEDASYFVRSLGRLEDYIVELRAVLPDGSQTVFTASPERSCVEACRAATEWQ